MSKKRSYRAPSNNGGWKLLSVVQLLVSIALAIVIVCAVGSEGFTKKDVKTWFKKDQEQQKPDDGEDGGKDETVNIEVTPIEAFGLMMLDGGVQTDNVRTLTAQVIDGTTGEALDELQSVEFSMDWKDGVYTPDMTTSTDINDYVTMEVNGMTATFTCLTGFETPITVTCRSTKNTDKYATAQLDYIKPVFLKVKFSDMIGESSVPNNGVYPHTVIVPYAASSDELETIGTEGVYNVLTGVDYHVIGTKSYLSEYTLKHFAKLKVDFTDEFKAYIREQLNASAYMPYTITGNGSTEINFNLSQSNLLNCLRNIGDNCGEIMKLFNKYDGPELLVSLGEITNYNSKHEEIKIACKYYVDLAIPVTVSDVEVDNPSIDFND